MAVEYPWQRWLVLLSFSMFTGFNAFYYMNFSTVTNSSLVLFGINTETLVWQYSAALLSNTLLSAFPAAMYIETHNYAVTGIGTLMQVLAGWVRYISVQQQRFSLTVFSSVLIGFGGGVIINTYTTLPETWFPPKERTFATSIAVQSNYFGWAVGALLVPAAVSEPSTGDPAIIKQQFESLMLWQAILGTVCLMTFLAFHRESPRSYGVSASAPLLADTGTPGAGDPSAPLTVSKMLNADSSLIDGGRPDSLESRESENPEGPSIPIGQALRMLANNPQYVLQCLCFAFLGGVSFTIPAVQDEVFESIGYTSSQNSVTNFVFIISGVIAGTSMGYLAKDKRHHGRTIKILFILAALCLAILTVLTALRRQGVDIGLTNTALWPFLILCMGGAGIGTLGFIGIALQRAVNTARPVGEAVSGVLVEWLLSTSAAVIPLCDPNNFYVVGGLTVTITILLIVFYREDSNGSDHHQIDTDPAAAAPAAPAAPAAGSGGARAHDPHAHAHASHRPVGPAPVDSGMSSLLMPEWMDVGDPASKKGAVESI